MIIILLIFSLPLNIYIKYVHLDFSGMFCGTGFVYLFHLSFICARIMKVCKLFLSLISWYLSKIGEWKWKTLLAINAKNWKVYINYLWDMLEIYIHTPINTNTQISRLFHFEKWTGMCLGYVCPFFKREWSAGICC